MRYLGIDFGLKRVGLATSEGTIASPYKVLEVRGLKDAVLKVEQVIKEGFDQIVVGLPEGKMGQTVKSFIRQFKKDGINVIEVSEVLSTQNAIRQMIKLNIPKKKRRENDAYSAAIILQDYLDEKI